MRDQSGLEWAARVSTLRLADIARARPGTPVFMVWHSESAHRTRREGATEGCGLATSGMKPPDLGS